jgi:hypothetical protein
MYISFKDTISGPPREGWTRVLTVAGERGAASVTLDLALPRGERITLSHGLRREAVAQLALSLQAWLDSPDSYSQCSAPDCSDPCLSESDFCGKHQD